MNGIKKYSETWASTNQQVMSQYSEQQLKLEFPFYLESLNILNNA